MWSGPNEGGRQLLRGKYRLLTALGHGGMADLYLAVSEGPAGFSKLIVIKRLRNPQDMLLLGMFLDEARLAARLSHPNIVATHEIAEEDGSHFIVMEHLLGPTVQQMRERYALRGRIPAALELEIMCHVLDGLDYAHELRGYDGKPMAVVHRDMSPENVIVTLQGECKILDFGIAKTLVSLNRTQAGFIKGKLGMMPPEQRLGEPVDRRADIFAAGAMLWEGLAGRSMWGERDAAAILHALGAREIPPLVAPDGDVPEELISICARAVNGDPEGRYHTAAQFRAAIIEYMEDHQLVVGRTDLAAFVTPLFIAERDRINRVVEAELTASLDRGSLPPLTTTRMPTPDGAGNAPGMLRPSPGHGTLEMQRTGTAVVTERRRGHRWYLFWTAVGVTVGIGLALLGTDRIRWFYRTLTQDQVREPVRPLPRPAATELESPALRPAPEQRAIDSPSGSARRDPVVKPTRLTAAALPRKSVPSRRQAAARRNPREIAWPREPSGAPTPGAGLRDSRLLDGENPYGRTSGAAPPAARRNIDRVDPWKTSDKAGEKAGEKAENRAGDRE